MEQYKYTSSFTLAFPSERQAKIALNSVNVDEEIRPDRICREVSVDGNVMSMNFGASEARFLRVAVSSFMTVLKLACQTIQEFDTQ